jgi:hypothetical protein
MHLRALRQAVTAVGVVALLLGATILVHIERDDGPRVRPDVALSVSAATPTFPPVVTDPTPPVVPAAALPEIPHDAVPPSAPRSFQMSGPAFDIQAAVCGMANVRPLDPPGDQFHTVCWVQSDFGVAPGSASGGTSYILGHSWSKATLVFNPMSELATDQVVGERPTLEGSVPIFPVTDLDGYVITLATDTGTLRYVVSNAYGVDKARAADVDSLMANTPDRVVLITCAVHDGVDLDYNIVVEAFLQSSSA